MAATEEKIAEHALREIEVEYEELPAMFEYRQALASNAPSFTTENPARKIRNTGYGASLTRHDSTNIVYHFHYERGDGVDRASAKPIRSSKKLIYLAGASTIRSVACRRRGYQGDQVTVWSGTQTPFPLRQEIARLFGLPFSRVRVIVPYVGGGYGAKSGVKNEALAVALSALAKKPVRVALSAEETFKTLCDPAAKVTIKTGVKKDGSFVARRCEVYFNGGAYANSVPRSPSERAIGRTALQDCPRQNRCLLLHNTFPAALFAASRPAGSFAYESQLHTIAHRLNLAPRGALKNLLDKGYLYTAGNIPIDAT